MKKILIITLLLSSILFGGGFTISSSESTTLSDTISNLQNQNDTTLRANSTILSTLADGNGLTGGWEDGNFRYIYKMVINSNDRLAIFIITKINNYDNNLVKALNMQDNIILLIDANAQTKLLWSGYALANTPTTGTSSIDVTITDDKSEILGVTLVNQDWIRDIVTYTFKFSKSVTGFDASDINVSGGTKGEFSGSGDTYTLEITPNKNSKTPIRVDVGANIALGDGGDNNKEATQAVQEVNTQKAFVTTWETDTSDDEATITISGYGHTDYMDEYNYNIDWGDGTQDIGVTEREITHKYDVHGFYTISITGNFPHFYFFANNSHANDSKSLLSIEQWGTIEWKSMYSSFARCINMEGKAEDKPDLSNVTDMSEMFNSTERFNQDINTWDVSNVTDMKSMFNYARKFNQPLNSWNVSNVTNMSRIFDGAIKFNQPLDNWNVSNVTSMNGMFASTLFNQNINNWNVSNVTNMSAMFGSTPFNQPLNNWNVANVTNVSSIFSNAYAFNQDISSWNLRRVTIMGNMFNGATSFNQPLNSWDLSRVTNISYMFQDATAFNQPLNNWDVSYVTVMNTIFSKATSFNQPLDNWDVSSATSMGTMFNEAVSFNQDISNWDVSNVGVMSYMFRGATSFNQDISGWDVSSVGVMSYMFQGATSFSNQDLSGWDVSNISSWGYRRDFATSWGTGNTEPIWND